MQDSSLNHLTQMQTFASMRSTPFMEIDDKGGEISAKISWEVGFGHEYGQRRGSNIEKLRRIKIL